jgi:hypothetical protein
MDWWTKLEGRSGISVSKAVAWPTCRRAAGTPGASPASFHKGRRTGQTVEEIMLPRRRANKNQPVALRPFSPRPRRIGSVGRGAAGSK